MDLAARYQAELVLLTVVQLPDAAQPDLTEYLRHEHEPDLPGVLVAEAARDELRSLSGRLQGRVLSRRSATFVPATPRRRLSHLPNNMPST